MYIPSAVTASLQFWLFMVHTNPHYRSPTSCGTVHPDNQTIQPSVLWDLERLNDIFKRTIYPLVRIWIFEKVTTAHMCEVITFLTELQMWSWRFHWCSSTTSLSEIIIRVWAQTRNLHISYWILKLICVAHVFKLFSNFITLNVNTHAVWQWQNMLGKILRRMLKNSQHSIETLNHFMIYEGIYQCCFFIKLVISILTLRSSYSKLPQLHGHEVDLYLLYSLVTLRGGWEKVGVKPFTTSIMLETSRQSLTKKLLVG